MPGPSAVLFNHETNTYEEVPADRVGAAIASGQYTAAGTTSMQAEGGLVTRPAEQTGAAAVQGEYEAGAANAARAAAARREVQLGLDSDKVLTFVEGVGDALTVGLFHGTGEQDELRREADSGSALLGQLVGTALGLKFPGPIKGLTRGGEVLGEGLAKMLLGEAESGFRGVVTRGLQEAGANAALMAASAFGHQITDSVIADKPFAAESIASEAGVGTLLGFGVGFAGSAFGQLARASRGAVEASGVAVKESRAALDAVGDLTRTWDGAVEQHAQRVGVLRVLADEGHVPGTFMAERQVALREAERARDALRSLDSELSLGGDAKGYQKWRDAVERYEGAARVLDEKMTPQMLEMASRHPVEMGAKVHLNYMPGGAWDSAEGRGLLARAAGSQPAVNTLVDMAGQRTSWEGAFRKGGPPMDPSMVLDQLMTPSRRAAYEQIHGRPYEVAPPLPPRPDSFFLNKPEEAKLGGKVTPTSDLNTNPGSGSERVLRAGERPAAQAETAKDFVNTAKKELLNANGEGKRAVRDYLNNWFQDFSAKPRVNIGDELRARLSKALDDIAKNSGGRLDSAGGLALFKSLGLKEAESPLGQRLDQVWSLGQAGKFAADEARGVKTPLRKGLAGQVQRYATAKGARALGAAVLGGSLGGPAGAIIGMALTSAGFAGKAASSAGKLMQQVATAGEALLKGRRATIAARALTGNRPYQYSDAGEIKDPVQRIMEVQRLAANPDAIRARVTRQLGDLLLTSPELAQHMIDTTVKHVQAISASAPAIMLNPMGRPIQPSGTALQRFFDFENAMHDLPGTLKAIGSGSASEAQIKALHIGFPAVHAELFRNIMGGTQALNNLEEAKLKVIERVIGAPLTRTTAEPLVTARYQANWETPTPPPKPAQAFKITASKPTTVQSASKDRAPGNERIAR